MTPLPHPPLRSLNSAEALGRVKASLAALAAGAALTRPARFDGRLLWIGGDFSDRKEHNTCWTGRAHRASR